MAGLVERTRGIAVTGVTAFTTVNVEITIFAPVTIATNNLGLTATVSGKRGADWQ